MVTVTLSRVWRFLKAVPSAIWLGLSIFGGGLLLGLKVMRTRYGVKDAKEKYTREIEDIKEEREKLEEAVKDGSNEALRNELLRGLRK